VGKKKTFLGVVGFKQSRNAFKSTGGGERQEARGEEKNIACTKGGAVEIVAKEKKKDQEDRGTVTKTPEGEFFDLMGGGKKHR